MEKHCKYRETDKMSDLICENYTLLTVMSRFGLSLGFGDQTVRQVCQARNVDYKTFLAVVNFMEDALRPEDLEEGDLSVESLMEYLRQAHAYFLDFNLPAIRRKLIEAIGSPAGNQITLVILKFYDDYVGEVRKHMQYEDRMVFTYVESLLNGSETGEYNISVFARRHNQISLKLSELKNILIKYYPQTGNSNLLNSVLFDIYNCEHDLFSHCRIEDRLFVPAVAQLEKKRQDEKPRTV